MFNSKHLPHILLLLGCLALPGAAAAAEGDLAYAGCHADDAAQQCVDLPGTPFQSADGVASSPDGRSVYVVGTQGRSVAHFFRGPGGELAYDGCVNETGASSCAATGTKSLGGAADVAVSPDGRSVYVTGRDSHSVTHFTRADQGQITFAGCWANPDPADGCTDVEGTRLLGAQSVAVSPDGGSLYVTAKDSGALTRLARNTATGELTAAGCWRNPDPGDACIDVAGGPFEQPVDVTVSPDGKSVYVVSLASDTVAHFFRDVEKGTLAYDGCVGNPATNCTDVLANPLDGPNGVAVSPDGKSVYVTGAGSGSITHFFRAPEGQIVMDGCVSSLGTENCADAPGTPFAAPKDVAVSPDGRSVYVTSAQGNSIAHLVRAPEGQITFSRCLGDNNLGCAVTSGNPFAGSFAVAVSPDSRSVYATGFTAAAVSRFDREPAPVATPTPTATPTVTPTVTPEPTVDPDPVVVTCAGRTATLVGTPGADRLRGTPAADVVAALGGRDRVSGLRGDDVVCGGAGRDRIQGGAGRDRCLGGPGRDTATSCETRRSA